LFAAAVAPCTGNIIKNRISIFERGATLLHNGILNLQGDKTEQILILFIVIVSITVAQTQPIFFNILNYLQGS